MRSPFASSSTKLHYARGLVGLLALAAAVAGAATGTPTALALLILTVAAWRGCPTCWAIGLVQTRECEACTLADSPPNRVVHAPREQS